MSKSLSRRFSTLDRKEIIKTLKDIQPDYTGYLITQSEHEKGMNRCQVFYFTDKQGTIYLQEHTELELQERIKFTKEINGHATFIAELPIMKSTIINSHVSIFSAELDFEFL